MICGGLLGVVCCLGDVSVLVCRLLSDQVAVGIICVGGPASVGVYRLRGDGRAVGGRDLFHPTPVRVDVPGNNVAVPVLPGIVVAAVGMDGVGLAVVEGEGDGVVLGGVDTYNLGVLLFVEDGFQGGDEFRTCFEVLPCLVQLLLATVFA